MNNGSSRDFSSNSFGKYFLTQRNWLYDAEPYSRTQPRTFTAILGDQRLKAAIRKAVKDVDAPQHLIDSIRENIRR